MMPAAATASPLSVSAAAAMDAVGLNKADIHARRTASAPSLTAHRRPLQLEFATSPVAASATNDLDLTLDDFVKDSHLHSIFLQYLSTHDKKGFARLLFLVSVEEFKKLLNTTESTTDDGIGRSSDGSGVESDHDVQHNRRMYASKIISKFMSQDSFLDIASENMKILNKSVWSFGSFLRNDLMMCAALSSKVDLFHDAEIAVKKALQSSFTQFKETKEYRGVLTSAKISYAFIAGAQVASPSPSTSLDDSSIGLNSASPSPSLARSTSYLTLPRVLGNRRLCSVFWVFLFKERAHQQLSLWMDLRYQLTPALESFVSAAHAELEAEARHKEQVEHDSEIPIASPGDLIEQILTIGGRICDKYLAADASSSVTFVAEPDQDLLFECESHITNCVDTGSFSLVDAEAMLRTIQKIASVIEYNLQVNDFVRFMGSESFKSLVASYQSRLLSPANSLRNVETPDDSISASVSSDCSMTTLQELFHCMNVPSHQPQRVRTKNFTLKELFQSQLRGQSQRASLISSVLAFGLDTANKEKPTIRKDVLFTLAKDSDLRHHHALPDHVESFFCPSGAKIVRARTRPEPKLFHMTIGNAEKSFYGACLTRYVPLIDDSQLSPLEIVLRETEGLEVFIPVGICIISRYPILDTLKKRLDALHVKMQRNQTYLNDPQWRPSEEQLETLLSPFDFSVAVDGSFTTLSQYVDFSMEELFNCLSVENVVALVNCMLLERQVVLVSSRYSVLTCVGETLKSLMAPLEWSHVFAPILPRSMLECLQCPTPYLFGVHSTYRDELSEMLAREGSCDNIVVVDLDANLMSARARPLMPEYLRSPLIANLQQLLKPRVYFSDYVPMCTPTSPQRRFPEARVRECFRNTMSQLLHPFEEFRFVLSDDFDFVVVFDRVEFLRRVHIEELPFYRSFLETQVFSHQIASVA